MKVLDKAEFEEATHIAEIINALSLYSDYLMQDECFTDTQRFAVYEGITKSLKEMFNYLRSGEYRDNCKCEFKYNTVLKIAYPYVTVEKGENNNDN